MGSKLDINVTEQRGVSILHLKGPIDASTQKGLVTKAEEVVNGGADSLIIDLTEVTFLGSAGLRGLTLIAGMFTGDNLTEQFSHIKLLNPSDALRRILKTLGFDDYLSVHDTLDQAIDSF